MNQQSMIVWGALAVSQLVYLLLPVPPREGAAEMPRVLPLALGVVSVVQTILIVALLHVRAFAPIRTGRLDPRSKEGAAQVFTTSILAWVLAESVAIYGLVLRILGFPLATSLPFALAGAMLLFIGRPWNAKLQRAASSAELARSGEPLR